MSNTIPEILAEEEYRRSRAEKEAIEERLYDGSEKNMNRLRLIIEDLRNRIRCYEMLTTDPTESLDFVEDWSSRLAAKLGELKLRFGYESPYDDSSPPRT